MRVPYYYISIGDLFINTKDKFKHIKCLSDRCEARPFPKPLIKVFSKFFLFVFRYIIENNCSIYLTRNGSGRIFVNYRAMLNKTTCAIHSGLNESKVGNGRYYLSLKINNNERFIFVNKTIAKLLDDKVNEGCTFTNSTSIFWKDLIPEFQKLFPLLTLKEIYTILNVGLHRLRAAAVRTTVIYIPARRMENWFSFGLCLHKDKLTKYKIYSKYAKKIYITERWRGLKFNKYIGYLALYPDEYKVYKETGYIQPNKWVCASLKSTPWYRDCIWFKVIDSAHIGYLKFYCNLSKDFIILEL